MSSGGSSGSSSSDDEDGGEDAAAAEPDSAAKQRALEEARAMLADRPRSKKKRGNAWFEEEVASQPACHGHPSMLSTIGMKWSHSLQMLTEGWLAACLSSVLKSPNWLGVKSRANIHGV